MLIALRVIGVIYGLIGTTSLLTVYMHAVPLFRLEPLSRDDAYFYTIFSGLWTLNAIVCLARAYAWWRVKWWARWPAVVVNAIHVALGVVVLVRVAADPPASTVPVVVVVGYVIFFGGLMAVCISRKAKNVMAR